MAALLFTCPKTHQQAPASIETDLETLRVAWSETLKVRCPLCGAVHRISVRETHINGALIDAPRSTASSNLRQPQLADALTFAKSSIPVETHPPASGTPRSGHPNVRPQH